MESILYWLLKAGVSSAPLNANMPKNKGIFLLGGRVILRKCH